MTVKTPSGPEGRRRASAAGCSLRDGGAPPWASRRRTSLAAAALLALACAVSLGCGTPSGLPVPAAAPTSAVPPTPTASPSRAELDLVVRTYRQIIVLMTDKEALVAADRSLAVTVGRVLFEANRKRLEDLEDRLEAEIAAGRANGFQTMPPEIDTFVSTLETAPEWHDADKLVFRDVVTGVADGLRASGNLGPAGKALLTRLDEDRKAVDEIHALYDRELDRVFAQLATRGMPVRREAWESYIAYLRTLYSAPGVLDEHRGEVQAPPQPAAGPPIHAVDGSGLPPKTLVITFDDGPHPRYTQRVLDILERFHIHSVFFELGEHLGRFEASGALQPSHLAAVSRAVRSRGNLVGNHTFTHPFLPKLPAARIADEIGLTSTAVEQVDATQPAVFRPPYGAFNDLVLGDAHARTMHVMLWNIDSQDWADPVPKSVANRVIAEARAKGRGVILFHDIHSQSVEALPLVIETLQADGFRFALWDGESILDPGPPPPTPAPEAPAAPVPLYRASFAVIVGIDDYTSWPKLTYATGDALAVRDVLIKDFSFPPENVTVLLDKEATRERIVSAIGDALANQAKVQPDDRVLVFFAGHGATRLLPSGRSLGYIVPVEADTTNLQAQCVSMTDFQDINESIAAKHVLYVMDACYGGLAVVRGGAAGGSDPRKYITEVTRRPARQMLTAGGPDEAVADNGPEGHSIFTWTLLRGLEGKADLNADGYVTASELFAYVGPVVSSLSKQTPAFGNLVGSRGGEFVFELRHEDEDLSAASKQLDDEGVQLTERLDGLRKEIAAKQARNEEIRRQVQLAEAEALNLRTSPAPAPAPETAQQVTDRALALYREKKYPEALAAFRAAFELRPTSAQIANNIGFVYYRMGTFADALAWYEKARALDPARAIAWANTGEVCEALARPKDAIAAYVRSRLKQLQAHE